MLVDDIRENMERSLVTGAVSLDLCKAFATVQHSCLLEKLPCYGIENYELQWLQDYLFNRTQVVQFNCVLSKGEGITHLVPPGSVLGPLLFAIQMTSTVPYKGKNLTPCR